MIILFSPSKGMKYKKSNYTIKNKIENINLLKKTEILISKLKDFSKDDLGKKLKIKDKILDEVFEIYETFYNQEEREAICLYDGVSFRQIDLNDFSENDIKYINKNVFIFSALYGVLSATTLIRPYRLDMTNKILDISPYDFWKNDVEKYFYEFKSEIFINLASNEFSKILNRKLFNIIDIEFRQLDGDKIKNISTEAKKARGTLLNYIIKNKIEVIDQIKKFDSLSYKFSTELSSEKKIVFIKKIG